MDIEFERYLRIAADIARLASALWSFREFKRPQDARRQSRKKRKR